MPYKSSRSKTRLAPQRKPAQRKPAKAETQIKESGSPVLKVIPLGGMREMIGQGTLFDQAHLMFGEAARGLTLKLGDDFHGMLVAILPPGAFLGLGLLIAGKNLIDKRLAQRASQQPAVEAEGLPSTPTT